MHFSEPRNGFQLDDHHPSDNQIQYVAFDPPTLVRHEDPLLTLVAESLLFELQAERALVDAFLEPWPEYPVNCNRDTDDTMAHVFDVLRNGWHRRLD